MKQRIVIISLVVAFVSLWLNGANAKPKISVVAVNSRAAEKGSVNGQFQSVNGQFQLVVDAPVSKPLTVSYAIRGSAKAGKDYKKIKAKVIIPAGQSMVDIKVVPIADNKAEKPEIIKLILLKSRSYLRERNSLSASIQITDEPVLGTLNPTTDPGIAQENTDLYRAFQEYSRGGFQLRSLTLADELAEYTKECEQATGIKLPKFSCKNGADVPNQEIISNGKCNAPNTLNHQCDPGSKFQVLPGRTQDAVAVAHCRKVGLPVNNDTWNDIAIIQYNKKNGALCFYQALTNLPGTDIPSPNEGDVPWSDGNAHWKTPSETQGIGCVRCHDNGGFIRSNYIRQMITPPHAIPSSSDGFTNHDSPVRYVGAAFSQNRSWSIKTDNAATDQGTNCSACHRMGVNNNGLSGTSYSLGLIATDETQTQKMPHGPSSPIWMRQGQVVFKAGAKATAQKYHDCAQGFINSGYITAPTGCTITALGVPYTSSVWRQFELGNNDIASDTGKIASVARIPNSMEIWWIGKDGSVQDAFWYEGAEWKRFELAPPGSASPQGGITAVSRVPNSMEMWWIAPNGSVQGAFWYEGAQWFKYELAPPGSASATGGITSVSRIPNSMELWWVGANGSVQGAFWYEGAQWFKYELASPDSASATGGISSVSRIPSSMELWWVGGNGSVQDAFWYEGGQWTKFELAPPGSASATGGISSVSRIPRSMEVWWIGGQGSIRDAFWYE